MSSALADLLGYLEFRPKNVSGRGQQAMSQGTVRLPPPLETAHPAMPLRAAIKNSSFVIQVDPYIMAPELENLVDEATREPVIVAAFVADPVPCKEVPNLIES